MSTRPPRRALACALLLMAGSVIASDLIYTPVNPNFGGYPSNGGNLLATANATNRHADAGRSSFFDQSPLAQFNQTLERTVLSQLASAATSKLIGADGKLVPGTFTTANFVITVVDLGNGQLRITTTDKGTGATTSFEVMQ